MKHVCWAVVAVGMLAGCAGTPPSAGADLAAKADVGRVCTTEKVVGSNRPVRTCRTAAQRDNERQHSRDTQERLRDGRPELPYDQAGPGG